MGEILPKGPVRGAVILVNLLEMNGDAEKTDSDIAELLVEEEESLQQLIDVFFKNIGKISLT